MAQPFERFLSESRMPPPACNTVLRRALHASATAVTVLATVGCLAGRAAAVDVPKAHCAAPHTPPGRGHGVVAGKRAIDAVAAAAAAAATSAAATVPSHGGVRAAFHARQRRATGPGSDGGGTRRGPECDAGFCVGPPRCYPTTSGHLHWYAEFDVPPLPRVFDPDTMTDYIYFNLVFGYGQPHDNPSYPACEPFCAGDGYGRFNQLMLGNVLCNSSNGERDPASGERYAPKWCRLDKWAIGAQYFFALYGCANHSTAGGCAGSFKSHAATGDLIDVEPGETVYTLFDRTGPGPASSWRLTTGVRGDRVPPSVVIVDKPYMGLAEGSPSWSDPTFATAYAGSCWELYGLHEADNYPPFMHYHHEITADAREAYWAPWGVDGGNASVPCRELTVANAVSGDSTTQRVAVNATMRAT